MTNEFEKKNFTDPDSNLLFKSKSRKTITGLDNNENMGGVLNQEATQYDLR